MKTKIPPITIGLDLGDKKHATCVLNKAGEIVDERSITNHRESLRRLSQKYPKARIALEVGTHSPWTSRILGELGHDVIVANPRKLRAIYTSNRKSDQTDARMIARIARLDPDLPGICTLLHRTSAEFTSTGITIDFAVLCQLVAPCRPSILFLSISSRFSHSLPSRGRSPFRAWPPVVVSSLSFLVFPQGT